MSMTEHYKIRCKCSVCGRTQVRKITDLLNGARCFISTPFGKPPCNGELNYYTEDAEDAQSNCRSLLGFINVTMLENRKDKLAELVDTVVDDIENWLSRHDTPQEMGWVDSRGLP